MGQELPAATPAGEPELPPILARLLDRFPQLRRRPHAMLAHFPLVFMLSATFFSILSVLTGEVAFDDTAFYCLGGGLLTMPATVATGLFTLRLNFYGGADKTVRIEKALSYCGDDHRHRGLCLAVAEPAGVGRSRRGQPHLLPPGPVPDAAGDGQRLFRRHAHLSPGGGGFPARCPERITVLTEHPDQKREFTLAEVAANSGADGAPVYIAFRGKVYDVSGSGLWEGGDHMGRHQAGHDLTDEFPDAPHGEEVFDTLSPGGGPQGRGRGARGRGGQDLGGPGVLAAGWCTGCRCSGAIPTPWWSTSPSSS